jgi:hypothetical protein
MEVTRDALVLDLEGEVTQGKETGRDARGICTHLALEAVGIDADVEGSRVLRGNIEPAV